MRVIWIKYLKNIESLSKSYVEFQCYGCYDAQ